MKQGIDLGKSKNTIIGIVVLVIALIVAFKIYQSNTAALEQLKQTKDLETKKNELLATIEVSDKKIKNYKVFLNTNTKVDKTAIVNNIGSIAKESQVKITSMKPASEQPSAFYVKYDFDLKVDVDTYEALGQFISQLEGSDDLFMVDVLSIQPNIEKDSDNLDRIKGLNAELKLSTYIYKD